ncbi:MAG: preprotein translocase subunit YajC [Ruminococcus sp.]
MRKHFVKFGLIASLTALAAGAMTVSASADGSTSASGSSGMGMMSSLLIMVLLFAVMYFILIRPQKKKEKEQKAMQNDLRMGDEVVTIGGVVGLVVKIGDDTVVIECGDRSRIRMKKWAIQENVTVREDAERARAAAAAEIQKKKQEKKKGKKGTDDSAQAEDQGMLKD